VLPLPPLLGLIPPAFPLCIREQVLERRLLLLQSGRQPASARTVTDFRADIVEVQDQQEQRSRTSRAPPNARSVGGPFELNILRIRVPTAVVCVYDHKIRGYVSTGVQPSIQMLDAKEKESFVAYVLQIRKGGREWNILRRYSSILSFRTQLLKKLHVVEPVAFPGKVSLQFPPSPFKFDCKRN
jgi:hypothetical protein